MSCNYPRKEECRNQNDPPESDYPREGSPSSGELQFKRMKSECFTIELVGVQIRLQSSNENLRDYVDDLTLNATLLNSYATDDLGYSR